MSEEMTEDEKESVFNDLLINFFMNNKFLYDKAEEKYSYTVEKLEKLKILQQYLKSLSIEKTVDQIVSSWLNLVKKFRQCEELEKNAKSGSGATSNDFPYYNTLLFLKESAAHRQVVSTMNVPGARTYTSSSTQFTLDIESTSRRFVPSSPLAIDNSYPEHSGSASPSNSLATNSASSAFSQPHTSVMPFSSYSTSGSNVSDRPKPHSRKLNVPNYDESAKKKLKAMNEEENIIQTVGKRIVETLDSINKSNNNSGPVIGAELASTSTTSSATTDEHLLAPDYQALLTEAVNKIPAGFENECIEYIFGQLEIFDKENESKDPHHDTI